MKMTFLRHLNQSGGEWQVNVFESREGEVWNGILFNAAGVKYPVISGLPRLLKGQWLSRCLAKHQDFCRQYGERFGKGFVPSTSEDPSPDELLKQRTVDNFSYQWKQFNKMLPIYEMNHSLYFHPRDKEFFAGRVGLDAGCGTGRHVYYAAKYGAEVVAVDLSEACEVAYENTRSMENVHVAQADIYDLPFKRDHFDFVESIGVIHILPDPQAAVRGLVKLLRPGGDMYVYVYSVNSVIARNSVEAIKLFFKGMYERVGRMLPRPALKMYCLLAASVGRTWNVPMRLLQRWRLTRSIGQKLIAFKSYEIYPFYVLHTDLFDWIGTPLNRYYTVDEVRSLYKDGPFDSVDIQEGPPQWRIFARKATLRAAEYPVNADKEVLIPGQPGLRSLEATEGRA